LLTAISPWQLEFAIDRASRSKKFGDQLACLVKAKDNPIFADTQAPETRKFSSKGGYVSPLASIYIVKGPSNVRPHTGMQCL
jgi:hypothetical protein